MATLSDSELVTTRIAAYDRAVEHSKSVDARSLDFLLKNAKKIEEYLVNGVIPE